MISDDRIKELMEQVGMPDSLPLKLAFKQLEQDIYHDLRVNVDSLEEVYLEWEDDTECVKVSLVNIAGESAYFYCQSCGAEYVAEEVGEIPYSRQTASGEYGVCPQCGEESPVDYED